MILLELGLHVEFQEVWTSIKKCSFRGRGAQAAVGSLVVCAIVLLFVCSGLVGRGNAW